MIRKYVFGRTCVFVDAANILYSQQTLGWRVDYEKLKRYLENECNLNRIYFYTGRVGDNKKQDSFLQKLGSFGYVVKAKEVKQIRLENDAIEWKGNLDVELALDAFRLRSGFDTILLFSGDSDFAYLLDLLRKNNKKVIVFSTRGHISKELIIRAKYIDLKKLRIYIELKIKEPQSGS